MSNLQARDIPSSTPLDRILKAWVAHELDKLSTEDQNILERISEIDRRMQAGQHVKGKKGDFSRPMRLKELVEWHTERFKISHRQAYADIAMAKQFFLSTETREDKEFARGQMIQQGEELMFEAASQSDFKSAAAFFKELRLLRGLDKIDAEAPDLSGWEPVQARIIADPTELGFEKLEKPHQIVERLLRSFKQKTVSNSLEDQITIEEL